jgi:hypothetical protein
MISAEREKEIIKQVEDIEYYSSGKRGLNGGYANADNVEIFEKNGTYIVFADIELGDSFDSEHPHKEIFENCKYYLDMKDLHMLEDKEITQRGFDGEEEIRDFLEE